MHDQVAWIDARNLSAKRGAHLVLHDVTLRAAPGELVVVRGTNGSGKSTLLEILALLRAPHTGQLQLFGEPTRDNDHHLRKRITLVMQPPVLLRGTVLKNVLFGLRMRSLTKDEAHTAAFEALARVSMSELAHRSTRELSAGERQRLNLARALALPVDALLLDEPTANLDAQGSEQVRAEIERIRDNRKQALVVATPNDPALLEMADRVVVLGNG